MVNEEFIIDQRHTMTSIVLGLPWEGVRGEGPALVFRNLDGELTAMGVPYQGNDNHHTTDDGDDDDDNISSNVVELPCTYVFFFFDDALFLLLCRVWLQPRRGWRYMPILASHAMDGEGFLC